MPELVVDNTTLWYECKGQGRPVLFLHAFAVTGAMWFPQVPVLTAAGYEVICVDQRGHGQSFAPPGPYSIPQMADDIHELISQLNLEGACVIGLSMGGRVALRLALDHPQDVAALVLVSAKSEPAREIRAQLEALNQRIAQGEVGPAVDGWFDTRYQRLMQHAPDLTRKVMAGWYESNGTGFAGAAQAIVEMESMTSRVSEICAPTLAVAGALDSPCHPFLAWYERSIDGCRGIIVPEAAHFVNIEQADRFNDLLLAFLAEQAG